VPHPPASGAAGDASALTTQRKAVGSDMAQELKDVTTILATDCGSTTTKAILIERKDGEYRLICRGEAPTTVEAPAEDVTRGVLNAVGEIEDLTRRKFIR